MKRLAFLAATALVASLLVGPGSPAQAASVTFTSTAVNQNGQNCMDVPGGSSSNNVQLAKNTCNGASSQSFTFTPVSGTTDQYTINTVTAGKCVDVYGVSTADGANIIQWTCNGQTNQRFQLVPVTISGTDKTFNLKAVHSSKCIVPIGDSAASGTLLDQLPCSSATARVWRLPGFTTSGGTGTFVNPLSLHGPDPWLQYYNGWYYLATTTWNNTITMRKSRTLGGLASVPDQVIFTLTRSNGAGTMWAPEFHLLNGPNGQRWYLYYVAGQEPFNLGTQRIHVLESSGLDPMGPYTFKADMLDPTQNNTWELDPSILQLNGNLYLLGTFYNGSQPNFIRPLSNPWTASGTRHILSTPTFSWENVGGAVNEGAEVIQHGGKTFIAFSASHCSTQDYKIGLLTWNGGDPLNQSSWVKSSSPIFQKSIANGVYAPGHNGFFKSPDGTEDWIVYHGNNSASGGCDMNRTTRAQKITWNADGTPNFGIPVALGSPQAVPSGEPAS